MSKSWHLHNYKINSNNIRIERLDNVSKIHAQILNDSNVITPYIYNKIRLQRGHRYNFILKGHSLTPVTDVYLQISNPKNNQEIARSTESLNYLTTNEVSLRWENQRIRYLNIGVIFQEYIYPCEIYIESITIYEEPIVVQKPVVSLKPIVLDKPKDPDVLKEPILCDEHCILASESTAGKGLRYQKEVMGTCLNSENSGDMDLVTPVLIQDSTQYSSRSLNLRSKSLCDLDSSYLTDIWQNIPSPRVTCLIAIYGRHSMVALNVHILSQQEHVPLVVLIVSTQEDQNFVQNLIKKYDNLVWIRVPNRPLGRKWQLGVEWVRRCKPDYLLILGSDDLLSINYISVSVNLLQKYNADLIGAKKWAIYESKCKSLYLTGYPEDQELYYLGAGRMYSADILYRLNWTIYEKDKDRALDRYGYNAVNDIGGILHELDLKNQDVMILSYKGEWNMINSMKKIKDKLELIKYSSIEKYNFFRKFYNHTEYEINSRLQ